MSTKIRSKLKFEEQVGEKLAATAPENRLYTGTQVENMLDISKATRQKYYGLLAIEPIKQGRTCVINGRQLDNVQFMAEYMKKTVPGETPRYPDDVLKQLRAAGSDIPLSERELLQRAEVNGQQGMMTKTIHNSPKKQAKSSFIDINNSESYNFLGSTLSTILSGFGRELGEGINKKSDAEEKLDDLELLDKRYEILEKCCDRSRKLTTSDLAKILGLNKSTLSGKKTCCRYGFTFCKTGHKSGAEATWAIARQD